MDFRFFCSGLFCHIHCFGAVPDVLERIRLQAFDKIQSQGSSFTFPPPSSSGYLTTIITAQADASHTGVPLVP